MNSHFKFLTRIKKCGFTVNSGDLLANRRRQQLDLNAATTYELASASGYVPTEHIRQRRRPWTRSRSHICYVAYANEGLANKTIASSLDCQSLTKIYVLEGPNCQKYGRAQGLGLAQSRAQPDSLSVQEWLRQRLTWERLEGAYMIVQKPNLRTCTR